jgi:hypothetical protein
MSDYSPSAMTFQDLIIEVAEFAGLCDYEDEGAGKAILPTDAHDLDKIKRVITNAIRQFMYTNVPQPTGFWRWRKRLLSVTLEPDADGPMNIQGDAGRYKLPYYFKGTPEGQITYDSQSNNGAHISWVSEQRIRQAREVDTDYSGYPVWAAIRPFDDDHYELLVYPKPSVDDTLVFPYTAEFEKITELTSRLPNSIEFDDAILAACKARVELELEDQGAGWKQYYMTEALPAAWTLDGRKSPRGLGYMRNRRGRLGSTFIDRVYNNVTYND